MAGLLTRSYEKLNQVVFSLLNDVIHHFVTMVLKLRYGFSKKKNLFCLILIWQNYLEFCLKNLLGKCWRDFRL